MDDLRSRVIRAIQAVEIPEGGWPEDRPGVWLMALDEAVKAADAALAEIGAVREAALLNIGEAMQELANSPLGVIPACAEKYYDGNTGVFTSERISRAIAEGKE